MEADPECLRRDLRRLLLLKALPGEPLGLLVLDGMVGEKRAELRAARLQARKPACPAEALP